jgi:hypothetical protein
MRKRKREREREREMGQREGPGPASGFALEEEEALRACKAAWFDAASAPPACFAVLHLGG